MSENDDGVTASNKTRRSPVKTGLRLAGTTLLILVSAMVYLSGLWMIYTYIFATAPDILRIIATVSAAIAPIQLVADIVVADREDRAERGSQTKGGK